MKGLGFIVPIGFLLYSCASPKALLTVESEADGIRVIHTYQGQKAPDRLISELRLDTKGDTVAHVVIRNGGAEVVSRIYHPKSVLKEEVRLANGLQDGLYQLFDPEGERLVQGQFKAGMKEGLWSYWYDSTQRKQECTYRNDRLDGKCTHWFIDGSLRREETFRDGTMVASQDF